MKKKIILINLFIILVALTTACSSYDKNYSIYNLWIEGVKVTTRNQNDILGDGTVSFSGNSKEGVLTLNNANLTETFIRESESVIISDIDKLTINLIGENNVGMGDKTPTNGIFGKEIVFAGEGSLSLGARAFGVQAINIVVNSGEIDTYLKLNEGEIATFISVGFSAQENLIVNDGDINVFSNATNSRGLYSLKDIDINGGNVTVSSDNPMLMTIGIIASMKLTIKDGCISSYARDDALNAKEFEMSGGIVKAESMDFVFTMNGIEPDGVCRFLDAKFTGGEFTLSIINRIVPNSVTLFCNTIDVEKVEVYGGDDLETLIKKDKKSYEYKDNCISIKGKGE